MDLPRGYIHLYTGNGKGKTTAALGLALRAAGAGKKVFIAQFVKGMHYSELVSVEKLSPNIVLQQFGRDCFIRQEPTPEDIQMANKGLDFVRELTRSGEYDMIILDEVCIALYYELFSLSALREVISQRRENMEWILTGRYASQELIDLADLVTEMVEVKHYYRQGVEAREGIEF